MRKYSIFTVLIVFSILFTTVCSWAIPDICEQDARDAILKLTSREFAGRRTGTEGNELAAKYLEEKLLSFGLEAFQRNNFRQVFEIPKSKNNPNVVKACNIIGLIPGNNVQLKDQYIVIGAHFDHIGQKKGTNEYYPGADDNGSGVSAVLEVAEYLAKFNPNKRSIVICFFNAEEIGLNGSRFFIENPPIPVDKIVAMINFDMVGKMQNKQLIAIATGSSPIWKPAITEASKVVDLVCPEVPNSISGSDHVSFYLKKIPSVFFITSGDKDIHTIGDTIEKINFPGIVKASNLVVELIKTLDKTTDKFIFTEVKEQKHDDRSQNKPKIKLGIIPDFAVSNGMGVGGVAPGSIAEASGLQEGDVIVKWNGNKISTIEDYTAQLAKTKSGDKAKLTITRGKEIIDIDVQF